MLKNRLIPVLFLKDGYLVRSEKFKIHQNLGNPIAQVDRYNLWDVDELIYIDISENDTYSNKRNDTGELKDIPNNVVELISIVAKSCFMPLTFGGRIKSIEDISVRMASGADKITINTKALERPEFITQASTKFGSQAIVLSVDYKLNKEGFYKVYSDRGTKETSWNPQDWVIECQKRGAGEILLNSIDLDGLATGYDIKLINSVVNNSKIPIIACGGVGNYKHFQEGIIDGNASAVAAGNIFHFKELAYPLAKKALKKEGLNFR